MYSFSYTSISFLRLLFMFLLLSSLPEFTHVPGTCSLLSPRHLSFGFFFPLQPSLPHSLHFFLLTVVSLFTAYLSSHLSHTSSPCPSRLILRTLPYRPVSPPFLTFSCVPLSPLLPFLSTPSSILFLRPSLSSASFLFSQPPLSRPYSIEKSRAVSHNVTAALVWEGESVRGV